MKGRLGDRVRVQHILKAVEEIEAFLKGVSYQEFEGSSLLQSAVIRQLEVLGEAAKHVSPAVQDAHPEVAWPQIVGLRNLLIHQYFGVNAHLIWQIATKDLDMLKQQMTQILAELPE